MPHGSVMCQMKGSLYSHVSWLHAVKHTRPVLLSRKTSHKGPYLNFFNYGPSRGLNPKPLNGRPGCCQNTTIVSKHHTISPNMMPTSITVHLTCMLDWCTVPTSQILASVWEKSLERVISCMVHFLLTINMQYAATVAQWIRHRPPMSIHCNELS